MLNTDQWRVCYFHSSSSDFAPGESLIHVHDALTTLPKRQQQQKGKSLDWEKYRQYRAFLGHHVGIYKTLHV